MQLDPLPLPPKKEPLTHQGLFGEVLRVSSHHPVFEANHYLNSKKLVM